MRISVRISNEEQKEGVKKRQRKLLGCRSFFFSFLEIKEENLK